MIFPTWHPRVGWPTDNIPNNLWGAVEGEGPGGGGVVARLLHSIQRTGKTNSFVEGDLLESN